MSSHEFTGPVHLEEGVRSGSLAGVRVRLTSVATIPMFVFDSPMPITNTWTLAWFVLAKVPYFLPCLFFGYLFGLVARRAAKSWGSDIGRVYGWNTCGSCLGILAVSFIGYEIPFFMMVLVIALLLFAMQEYVQAQLSAAARHHHKPPRWAIPLAASGMAVIAPFVVDLSRVIPNQKLYCGRDGWDVATS